MLSVRLAFWIVVATLVVRAFPLPRAHQWLAVKGRRRVAADPEASAARLARCLDRLLALDVLVFRPSCWRRAMVLHRFLGLEGVPTRINFGVSATASGLAGHAWLERDGRPFLERSTGAHTVIFSLPLPPSFDGPPQSVAVLREANDLARTAR